MGLSLKKCEIVTNADQLRVDIQETCMKYTTIKEWAYILHDKDDTRPHYHIMLSFGRASVPVEQIAKWFDVAPQFVSKIKTTWERALEYLMHIGAGDENKHRYLKEEVHASFSFMRTIEKSKILGDFAKYSYAQELEYVNTLPVSEKGQAFSQLERLWRLECSLRTMNSDRNLSVMFVTGKAGAGKTYYARRFCEGLGIDYCVSSASNDPMQDYLGQDALILDDLRPDVFLFPDLLKLLDNHTSSTVKSRFSNKPFKGKLIIITSSRPLHHWYSELRLSSSEGLEQLYRRIGSYVEVSEQTVVVYTAIDKNGRPAGLGKVYKNELYDLKKKSSETPKINVLDVFDKICESSDDLPF
jgi:plasmid replication protein